MARFRHLAAADEGGWARGMVLPHTRRSLDHFDRHHGGGGSLDINNPKLFRTKIINHGETRYAVEVHDTTDGWSEWALHEQVGPDIDDPDHWQRMGVPQQVHPFCNCLGESDEHDLNFPPGVDDGYAGYADGSQDDRSGVKAGKAAAEEAFQNEIAGTARPGIGDYDINKIMRDEGFR
jgi:hypothetical protein